MKFKSFIFTLLALLIASCTLQPVPELDEPGKEEVKLVTINVTVSPETRVAYDDANRTLAWETGDKLLLAGYDGTTYKGSKIFEYTGNGNTFQGQEVTDATSYKAYYPGDIITLDASGNVQIPANFWDQTQNGNNTTAHLRNKLLLFDESANPLNQTFSLALKSSIIRFDLTNVPQEIGTLSHIVWTEETATGIFKSMTLHVTGVTLSATNNSLTAFLSFDPAVMKIIAGGEYRVELYGEKLSFQSNTVASEKNYAAGDRYKGHISNWNPAIDWINPLSYFAEHNMANLTGTFETGHNTSGQYLFRWYNAITYNTTPAPLGGKSYYLPTLQEWLAIIPDSGNEGKECVHFFDNPPRTLSNMNVTVGGESYTMSGTFDNIGSVVYATLTYTHQSYPTLYSIARYRTENMGAGNANARLVIDMKKTATPYTMDEAKNADWGAAGVVSRVFPAAGYRYDDGYYMDQGYFGKYWTSSEAYTSVAYHMDFYIGYARSGGQNWKDEFYSVRLVSRE
ncbi:MAG TPA: hypothetical protein PK979_03110 [Bacteroidales bacterium]|nr:hypothetical protein [Bacteroidales bacterium]